MRKWYINIADLTFYNLWHKGDLLKKFYIWRQVCHHWKQLFEREFSCLKGLLHKCFQLHIYKIFCRNIVLYCFFIHSCNRDLKCKFELLDCWLPSIIWGADFVPWEFLGVICNFWKQVASHCKRVHFRLKLTPFHFLSLSCWKWLKSMRH